MNKTVLRYGLYGALITIAFFAATVLLIGNDTSNWDWQEVLGYFGIVLSLTVVYFGIRHYRDKDNGGKLSFGQGMKTGMLITLLPAFGFALVDMIMTKFFMPDIWDKYQAMAKEKLAQKFSGAALEQQLTKLGEQVELYRNPLFMFGLMFITVVLIGIVITVISTLILKTKTAKS